MMFNLNKEKTFKKLLKEIELQEEAFSREKMKLYEQLGLTPEDVEQALNNQTQYSQSDRETLLKLQKEMDAEMEKGLKNIRDPEKAKKSYESLNLPSWALFCR